MKTTLSDARLTDIPPPIGALLKQEKHWTRAGGTLARPAGMQLPLTFRHQRCHRAGLRVAGAAADIR